MNSLQTFEQFLTTTSTQFSLVNYSINLVLTALLAYLLGLLYNKYGHSLSNRKSFSKNFVMLAVTTMIVISIVKTSLALSLGLVGALSIVRFRAAIKEPEELTFLFLNIALGLGFGADQKLATIIGFLFVAVFLFAKNLMYKTENYNNQSLIMTVGMPGADQSFVEDIVGILQNHTLKTNLKRLDENNENVEATFIIEVDSFDHVNKIKNQLRDQFSGVSVSLLDNHIII